MRYGSIIGMAVTSFMLSMVYTFTALIGFKGSAGDAVNAVLAVFFFGIYTLCINVVTKE
jgi:hypothetical protein